MNQYTSPSLTPPVCCHPPRLPSISETLGDLLWSSPTTLPPLRKLPTPPLASPPCSEPEWSSMPLAPTKTTTNIPMTSPPVCPPTPPMTTNAFTASSMVIFVNNSGISQVKRPRRRPEEIERLYQCNYPGCTKAYGTLNHLNAHVAMQQHGKKRLPHEFEAIRRHRRRASRRSAHNTTIQVQPQS